MRMPVIIRGGEEEKCLSPLTDKKELSAMLEPLPDECLTAHTISPMISRTGLNKNKADLITLINIPDRQHFFNRQSCNTIPTDYIYGF